MSNWTETKTGLVFNGWTPDKIAERNEQLAWRMRNHVPWHLIGGHLLGDDKRSRSSRDSIADDLRQAMQIGRGQWKGRMRDLALSGELVNAEGTYGALGAYPLPGEISAFTPTAGTEGNILTSAANAAVYMPIPQNGLLTPQAYRFVIAGRVTTSNANTVTWTIRLGNANTSPSLGASAAIAKTTTLTNATFIIKGDATIQTVGPPGTNSKAMGHFQAFLNSAVGGAATQWVWGSSAQASFDATVAPNSSANGGQFWVGITEATASSPWTVGGVHYMDWN